MNEDFNRFKKRVWRDVFIKCGVAGLAAGFLAVAVVLLALRLSEIHLLWVFYVLIAVGGCAVGFGVAFLLLRTDDGKIAKRLDAELGLNERAQTALCYQSESGDMVEMQRNDASDTLSAIPTKKLPFKHLAVTIALVCVFAVSVCALPVITATTPSAEDGKSAATTPVEPPRHVTDWEWEALDELIEYVKASKKADAYLRTGALEQLEGLRAILVAGVSQSGLTSFVRNTANEIRNVVTDANDRAATDEQKTLNTQEGNYIVNRLYEIFSLAPDNSGEEKPPDEGGDEENDPNGGGGTGSGKLHIDDTPFFDPEKANTGESGYAKLGEVRDEYYQKAQQALNEGVISREEWEFIVSTYFSDLTAKEDQP